MIDRALLTEFRDLAIRVLPELDSKLYVLTADDLPDWPNIHNAVAVAVRGISIPLADSLKAADLWRGGRPLLARHRRPARVAKRVLRGVLALALAAEHGVCSVEPPAKAASRSQRALRSFVPLHSCLRRCRQRGRKILFGVMARSGNSSVGTHTAQLLLAYASGVHKLVRCGYRARPEHASCSPRTGPKRLLTSGELR